MKGHPMTKLIATPSGDYIQMPSGDYIHVLDFVQRRRWTAVAPCPH